MKHTALYQATMLRTVTGWLPYSSAVCWLFAEYLYPHVNHPIGLVESSWGGTPVEAWSPPEAFTACAHHNKRSVADDSTVGEWVLHTVHNVWNPGSSFK